MSRGIRILAGGTLFVVLLGAFWVFAIRSVMESGCGNRILTTSRSPDGALDLVTFERDCGATTGLSTQASLLRAGSVLPNASGNVFIADESRGEVPGEAPRGPELSAQWKGPRQLLLRYDPGSRVHLEQHRLFEVEIDYEKLGGEDAR